jgi:hypothetical protein
VLEVVWVTGYLAILGWGAHHWRGAELTNDNEDRMALFGLIAAGAWTVVVFGMNALISN